MPNPVSQEETLQAKVVARLQANDSLVPAPTPTHGTVQWLTEAAGDIISQVQAITAGPGIVGIVLTPGGDPLRLHDPDSHQVAYGCPLVIEIHESVMTNRDANIGTQITALMLKDFVARRLNLFNWRTGQTRQVSGGGRQLDRIKLAEKWYEQVSIDPLLIYQVRFIAPLTLQ